jgi:hypothetical protein
MQVSLAHQKPYCSKGMPGQQHVTVAAAAIVVAATPWACLLGLERAVHEPCCTNVMLRTHYIVMLPSLHAAPQQVETTAVTQQQPVCWLLDLPKSALQLVLGS